MEMKNQVDKTYSNVIAKNLKLKGKIICKQKNKIIQIPTEVQEDKFVRIPVTTGTDTSTVNEGSTGSDNSIEKRIEAVKNNPNLTNSEKSFMIARIKRTGKRINEALKEGHRDRIEKFNSKLSKLSEHFDIPRVGPG